MRPHLTFEVEKKKFSKEEQMPVQFTMVSNVMIILDNLSVL